MDYSTLLFAVSDGLATITLNRPDEANALNLTMSQELMNAAIECDENPEIRAVLITGSGKMFSAGGDIKAFMAAESMPHLLKEMTLYLHGAISRFSRMDPPLIVAVNGTAAGGGFSLAMAGDLVISAASAKFVSAYTRSALSPDGSSTYFLPRAIGLRRAAELLLTNRVLSAQEALDWQLITRVVPDEDLLAEATALGHELASGPTLAYGRVKRMLLDTFGESLETQMETEARNIADMARSRDTAEGIAAFVEKRPPNYLGC
jgi:2-(1,2-epoxy-1,2-dihydrophenyl)acetyl-CoA isomerase